ncbi:hypothetical protein AX16_005176 [Volvariella volvacea WC 439]|nr:hypothetical protein AX16_005176 [Volvariella volvacea WC 439]
MLSWFYFGANCIQMHDYWTVTQKGDPWRIRIYAFAVFGFAFIQTLLVTSSSWQIIIMNWGGPDPFAQLPRTAVVLPSVNAFIAFVVQMWFAWRIYDLSKERESATTWRGVSCAIGALSLTQLGTSIGVVVKYFAIGRQPREWHHTYPIFGVWIGTTVLCDTAVAASLYLMLIKPRKESTEKGVQLALELFVTCFLETGAIIVTVGVLLLVLFFTCRTNYIHFVPLAVLGRLYSNVHLATLNARKRKSADDPTLSAPKFSQIIFARDTTHGTMDDTRISIPLEDVSTTDSPERKPDNEEDRGEGSSSRGTHTAASSSKGLEVGGE